MAFRGRLKACSQVASSFLFVLAISSCALIKNKFGPPVKSYISGEIFSIAELPDGSLIVGGDFSYAGDEPAERFGRFNSTGEIDGSFPVTGFNGRVRDMVF